MTGETVKIELTNDEATQFVAFRKHQDLFFLLYNAGVFNVKNGEVVIHFNQDGTIMQINTTSLMFRRGKLSTPLPRRHNLDLGG